LIGKTWQEMASQNDIPHRIDHLLRRRIQKLCRGTYERPAKLDKHLKCIWLHKNHPFLKLSPFKIEFKQRNPQVAVLHDFASPQEIQNIKNLARGKLKSTPLYEGNTLKGFTRRRTSKVMYMNELLVPEVSGLSKNIELATGFQLKHERFASENFQVMNYGIGGDICSFGFIGKNLF